MEQTHLRFAFIDISFVFTIILKTGFQSILAKKSNANQRHSEVINEHELEQEARNQPTGGSVMDDEAMEVTEQANPQAELAQTGNESVERATQDQPQENEEIKAAPNGADNQTDREKEQDESPPEPGEFFIPADDDEMEKMIEGMVRCGMRHSYAEANIKARKADFKRALNKFEREKKKKELPAARPTTRQQKANQNQNSK